MADTQPAGIPVNLRELFMDGAQLSCLVRLCISGACGLNLGSRRGCLAYRANIAVVDSLVDSIDLAVSLRFAAVALVSTWWRLRSGGSVRHAVVSRSGKQVGSPRLSAGCDSHCFGSGCTNLW